MYEMQHGLQVAGLLRDQQQLERNLALADPEIRELRTATGQLKTLAKQKATTDRNERLAHKYQQLQSYHGTESQIEKRRPLPLEPLANKSAPSQKRTST